MKKLLFRLPTINIQSIGTAILFVILFLSLTSYTNAQSDTVAPQLVSFSFSPSSIDTSTSSQTVTVTARITDNLSGYNGGSFSFQSPSTQQTVYGNFNSYNRISGNDKDGIYQTTVTFPQYSETGTWKVNYVSLFPFG